MSASTLSGTAATKVDTRASDWQQCVNGPWYPTLSHGGLVAYRIWQQFDGLRWFQRHEWRHADGSTSLEDWIKGAEEWCPSAQPVKEAA